MTYKQKLQKVMKQHLELSTHGIGCSSLSPPEQRKEEFERYRQDLLRDVERFRKTCEWLSTKKKRKTINMKYTSYGIKHIAEKEIGYITNGTLIAAAIYCGFTVKYTDNNPNVRINISGKELC